MGWSNAGGGADGGLSPTEYIAGRFYAGVHGIGHAAASTAANRLYLTVFQVGKSSLTAVGLGTRTGAAGNMKVGLYSSTLGRPDALITGSATQVIASGNNNNDTTFATPVTLTPGSIVWIGILTDSLMTSFYSSLLATDPVPSQYMGSTDITQVVGGGGSRIIGETYTTGTLYADGLPADLTGLSSLYAGASMTGVIKAG